MRARRAVRRVSFLSHGLTNLTPRSLPPMGEVRPTGGRGRGRAPALFHRSPPPPEFSPGGPRQRRDPGGWRGRRARSLAEFCVLGLLVRGMISALAIEGLSVERGGRVLFSGLSARVSAGEALVVTGRPTARARTSLLRAVGRPAAARRRPGPFRGRRRRRRGAARSHSPDRPLRRPQGRPRGPRGASLPGPLERRLRPKRPRRRAARRWASPASWIWRFAASPPARGDASPWPD